MFLPWYEFKLDSIRIRFSKCFYPDTNYINFDLQHRNNRLMYLSSSKFIFSYVGLFPANWRKIFLCKQIISQVFILLLPLCKKRDLHNSVCLLVNLVTGNWCKYSKLLANLNCKSNFCLSLCISCYWLPFCKSSYWLTYTANLVIVYPGANLVIG